MSILNCKLYKEFYPIQDEEVKDRLINENKNKILKYIYYVLRASTLNAAVTQMDYYNKRKNEISSSGRLIQSNVLYNESLARDQENDYNLRRNSDDVVIFEELLENYEQNEFTIDDANYFLEQYNKNFLLKLKILGAFICSAAFTKLIFLIWLG
jgi:hypothetical protein